MPHKKRVTEAKAVRDEILDAAGVLATLADDAIHVAKAAELISNCIALGGKVLLCGNGGSAAQAQHMAAELVGRFKCERRPLPAIALTTDTSILTAVGNDYSIVDIFSRQVAGLCNETDVLVALSTSGNSPNVVAAANTAHTATGHKAMVIAMTGAGGGALADIADCLIRAKTSDAALAQLCHLEAIHVICGIVEKGL